MRCKLSTDSNQCDSRKCLLWKVQDEVVRWIIDIKFHLLIYIFVNSASTRLWSEAS